MLLLSLCLKFYFQQTKFSKVLYKLKSKYYINIYFKISKKKIFIYKLEMKKDQGLDYHKLIINLIVLLQKIILLNFHKKLCKDK